MMLHWILHSPTILKSRQGSTSGHMQSNVSNSLANTFKLLYSQPVTNATPMWSSTTWTLKNNMWRTDFLDKPAIKQNKDSMSKIYESLVEICQIYFSLITYDHIIFRQPTAIVSNHKMEYPLFHFTATKLIWNSNKWHRIWKSLSILKTWGTKMKILWNWVNIIVLLVLSNSLINFIFDVIYNLSAKWSKTTNLPTVVTSGKKKTSNWLMNNRTNSNNEI